MEAHGSDGMLATVTRDLSTSAGARVAAQEASSKFGVINVPVNVAGMHDAGISTLDTSDEQWAKTFPTLMSAHLLAS